MLSSFLSLLLSLFLILELDFFCRIIQRKDFLSESGERERERFFFHFSIEKKGGRKGGDKSPSMRFTEPKITDGTETRGLCVQR